MCCLPLVSNQWQAGLGLCRLHNWDTMLPKAASGLSSMSLKRSEAVWSANEQGQDQVHRIISHTTKSMNKATRKVPHSASSKTETKLTNSEQMRSNLPKFTLAVVKVVRGKDQWKRMIIVDNNSSVHRVGCFFLLFLDVYLVPGLVDIVWHSWNF